MTCRGKPPRHQSTKKEQMTNDNVTLHVPGRRRRRRLDEEQLA